MTLEAIKGGNWNMQLIMGVMCSMASCFVEWNFIEQEATQKCKSCIHVRTREKIDIKALFSVPDFASFSCSRSRLE